MDEDATEAPIILLTQSEVAKKMGKSESVVQSLRKRGRISYIPGRPVLFEARDVDAYIAARDAAIYAKKAPYIAGTPEYEARIAHEQYMRIEVYYLRQRIRAEELLKKK